MSIEDEKHQVAQLRFVENLTLQEIAHRLGKSIYWVYSRVNEKYEPHRKRLTASDEQYSPTDEAQDKSTIMQEVEKIQKLRQEGLSYGKIAARLNRSVYWVCATRATSLGLGTRREQPEHCARSCNRRSSWQARFSG